MYTVSQAIYAPTLREKGGEIEAAKKLHPLIKDWMLPIWIALPQKKDKPFLRPTALAKREVGRVQAAWDGNVGIWDPSHLIMADDPNRDAYLLGFLLDQFLKFGCRVIPLANLRESYARLSVMANHARKSGSGIAVRVSIDDFDETELLDLLLANARLAPSDCVLVLDLGEPDDVDLDDLAESLGGWVETFLSKGEWGKIVVSASSYPFRNPAPKNGTAYAPRHEWNLWTWATEMAPQLKSQAIFGDYGADGVIRDLSGGGIPIPHARYAESNRWRIERVSDTARIRVVMQNIRDSPNFAGRAFSAGDEYFDDCASGVRENCGTPTEWRFANMSHHITTALHALAVAYERTWPERVAQTPAQGALAL